MINNCTNIIQFALYPSTCALCGNAGQHNLDLCAYCFKALPWNRRACRCCAEPLPPAQQGGKCGRCQKQAHAINTTICAFHYEYPVDHLIKQFKFEQRLSYGHLLGELLAKQIHHQKPALPDWLIPVPLHHARQLQRGFNQSHEIARVLSRRFEIPIRNDLCVRIKKTQTQSELPLIERTRNLRNAFQINTADIPTHVTIVDDVITSGTTVGVLANALKQAGVEKIDVWALARRA